MKAPIIIIGIGELAGVFARGFLRCGYPVYPITREMDLVQESQKIPSPELVLVAVQENKLHPILEQLPKPWHNKVGLLQNELLPRDWQQHNLKNLLGKTIPQIGHKKRAHGNDNIKKCQVNLSFLEKQKCFGAKRRKSGKATQNTKHNKRNHIF